MRIFFSVENLNLSDGKLVLSYYCKKWLSYDKFWPLVIGKILDFFSKIDYIDSIFKTVYISIRSNIYGDI